MVGLCRLCASLRKVDVFLTIRDDSSEICEKVLKCCQIHITMSDPLPKSICQECINILNNSYKFYIKVKEAQETLQALYPSSGKETKKTDNSSSSLLVETLSVCNESFKQKPMIAVQSNKEIKENSLSREDDCTIEISTEDSNCESPYDILEIDEEEIEDLTARQTDICVQPLMLEHHRLEEDSSQDSFTLLNKNALQFPEGMDEKNYVIPDNETNFEEEYMEYYEEEEDENEEVKIIDINRNPENIKKIEFSSVPAHLKLNSWKSYKFLCFICEDIFYSFISLKSHLVQEHDLTEIDKFQYKCYDCKKNIPRYNFFLNHVRSKHHHALQLKCDGCDLTCQNFQELADHRNCNCAEAKSYAQVISCNECFKSFNNVYGLQNHIRFQHNESKAKTKYQCTQCHKEFRYKSCLRTHEQMHTDTKNFFCVFCDRKFYNKLGLEQHLYVHMENKSYKCNICNKSYKTFKILDEHQKLHTSEKGFKCQFCDKYFSKKIQKVTHERSHTGEKPFSCVQCDKRFRHRSALYAHSKIHTGHKPYSCEFCMKTFADSSNRNKHVRRMHSKKKNV